MLLGKEQSFVSADSLKVGDTLSISNNDNVDIEIDKDSEEESNDKKVEKAFNRVLTRVLLYLIFWGLSFLMYYILR